MVNHKNIYLAIVFLLFTVVLYSQSGKYEYAFVTVEDREFSKKLKVKVDLGDTSKQIKKGEEFSTSLNKIKSHASILNFMGSHKFELIETKEMSASYQGSGGSNGIVFIMRKELQSGIE